jgi:hypothetical protein
MSRHPHPQARARRQSEWNLSGVRAGEPRPGSPVAWQDRHGRHTGRLLGLPGEEGRGGYLVLEDGHEEAVVVAYARRTDLDIRARHHRERDALRKARG